MVQDLLYSPFIIDGAPKKLTPAQMLRECTAHPPLEKEGDFETIADERRDPAPGGAVLSEKTVEKYAKALDGFHRGMPLPFAGSFTASKVARALLDTIWYCGHFRLPDLSLKAAWKWQYKDMGEAAAFYESVESACNYIDALGIGLETYSVTAGAPSVSFKANALEQMEMDEEEELFSERPSGGEKTHLGRRRKALSSFVTEPSDWILYIPFDSCDFRLGGSALAEVTGARAAAAAEVGDADCFMDCFEVVRELVEDGIVKAGATVGEGGLMTALRSLSSAGTGADVSISEILRSYGESSPLRVLFGEVPGVVIQIADIDYDYVDAEFILQDVVYFPLGHPVPGSPKVKVSDRVEIPQILESLLNTLEGED